MLILLEGPDGAGKTTLADELQRRFPGVSVTHHGPYKGFDSRQLAGTYMASLKPALVGQHVVLDRCWLSEPIYSRVYRDSPSRLLPAHRRMLERAALSAGCVVIRCLPPVETCLDAFLSGRDEMLDSEEQLRRVYDGYLDQAFTALPEVIYDYTTDTVEALLASAQEVAVKHAHAPKVLLIGERANTRTHEQAAYSVPFVSFTGLGCSEWLAEQLDLAGIREDKLLWLNAYTANGEELSPTLIDKTVTQVIALGRVASAWCMKHNISHTVVPHPQYHKRFYHAQEYPLIKELRRVS